MDAIKQPEPMIFSGNIDANWKSFKQRFELYLLAIGTQADEKRKTAILLTCAGAAALEVYNSFEFPDDANDAEVLNKEKYVLVIKKFDDYCAPKTNETYERFVFRQRKQQSGESFETFLTDLKLKSRTCNYSTLKDGLIRDQVVYGVGDDKVRARLLRQSELTLELAAQTCRAAEVSQLHISAFTSSSLTDSAQVHVIKKKSVVPDEKKRVIKIIKNCKFCATDHPFRKCPAYGKKCENCSRMNHSAKACFSSKSKVDYIEADESTDDDSAFFVGSIEEGQVDAINWIMPLKVNGESIEFKIDTGSHVNLMTNKQFNLLPNKPTLNEEEVSLRAYNNTKIINHGL